MSTDRTASSPPDPPPEEAVEAEHHDDAPEPEQEHDDGRGERIAVDSNGGGRIPAGQLLIGALSTLILGGWGLVTWLGTQTALLIGGGLVAAGGYAAYHRYGNPGGRRSRSSGDRADGAEHGGRGRRSRVGGGLGLGLPSLGRSSGGRRGGSTSGSGSSRSNGVGKRMAFGSRPSSGTGRRSSAATLPRLLGSGTTRSRTASGLRGGGKSGGGPSLGGKRRMSFGGGKSGRSGTGRTAAAHRSGGAASGGRASRLRAGWRRLGGAASRARAAGRRLDSGWARAARTLGGTAGRGVLRAGRWADRRTGKRASTWWKTTGADDAARARAAARAVWAWLSTPWRRWRRRGAPEAEAVKVAPEQRPKTTTEEQAKPQQAEPNRIPWAQGGPLYRRSNPMTTPGPMPSRGASGLVFPGGMNSPLVVMSADMVGSVARFLPPDMWWVEADLAQLEQVPANVAAALRVYFRNLETGYPIDHRITDMSAEFTNSLAKTTDYAMAIHQAFQTIHSEDIKRRVAPRTNEQLWNV